jgi:predicted PurR-regulated permease PerM
MSVRPAPPERWLWGVVGMILAVPLTVIAKIIPENICDTRPLATLISNE